MKLNRFSLIYSSSMLAFVFCLLCFGGFFMFSQPVIAAYEDLHVEYLLAGGYGQAPTFLLHYLYGWHPLLFSPVYLLYKWMPGTNWYGIFLVLLQFIAHWFLLIALLKRLGNQLGLFTFLVFFLLFGSVFLMQLELSTTSSLLAMTACTRLLLVESRTRTQPIWKMEKEEYSAVLLVLVALLLRLHTAALVMALFSVAALIVQRFSFSKRFIPTMIAVLVLSLLLFKAQELFYQQDPSYSSRKEKSDLYFKFLNRQNPEYRPIDSLQKLEFSFIQSFYWIDSTMISAEKIGPMIRSYTMASVSANKEALYWAFQNNRLLLVLFTWLMLSAFLIGGRMNFIRSALLVLLAIGTYAGILLFFKMRPHIILSIGSFCFLAVLISVTDKLKSIKASLKLLLLFGFLSIASWKLIQLKKQYQTLFDKIAATQDLIKAAGDNRGNIYFNLSNEGWQALKAFDSPNEFPLKNMITREIFMTGSYTTILAPFNIIPIGNGLVDHPSVFLLGNEQPDWKIYYQSKKNLLVEQVPVTDFAGIACFQLKSKP